MGRHDEESAAERQVGAARGQGAENEDAHSAGRSAASRAFSDLRPQSEIDAEEPDYMPGEMLPGWWILPAACVSVVVFVGVALWLT